MEPKYLTWNFANFVSVNLMVLVLAAGVMLIMKWRSNSQSGDSQA